MKQRPLLLPPALRSRWTLLTWCSSNAPWKVAADQQQEQGRHYGAAAARTHSPHLEYVCSGAMARTLQILGGRLTAGRFGDSESAGDAASYAVRFNAARMVDSSQSSPRITPLQDCLHRAASASSCTRSDAAADGHADAPTSDAHQTDLFASTAAEFALVLCFARAPGSAQYRVAC